ncbi:uncharacterized protein LOC127255339 isoform X2 [Andrographis paniculata]|uniref:uncharacterized protein LOC127255339 isoform X2 n=1 Tax=Andrographis paniculata TaxID=175694 RepID=UPI0021E7831B|nr:uncharacterized protein LOC127255339 isoform X2 [Andrographis paniculata]
MALRISPCFFLLLHSWLLLISFPTVSSSPPSQIALKLLTAPPPFSNKNSAIFAFQAFLNRTLCNHCSAICKLDGAEFSACEGGNVSYTGLADGNHSFEACANGTIRIGCANYSWIVDTVSPTAYITADALFTSAPIVSINISFSEPCGSRGGFRCSSVDSCNLLVYGSGEVLPETLNVLEPNMKYSIAVRVSEKVRYGRLILVMDRNFCADYAGNEFVRTENSSLFVHFDRRSVFANLRTHIPERLLQINNETRTVLATNKNKNLKVYLYFSGPVMNSSADILSSLDTNQGSFVSIGGSTFGQRRFGYQLTNVSDLAVVTLSVQSNLVITRQGSPVSPVAPVTFLYDSQRPTVKLSTTCNNRTKEKNIVVLIKFIKPVLGFNSSHLSISGGHLQSFEKVSWSNYVAHVQAVSGTISVSVPENITTDVSGNGNRASNTLQVMHYSVPLESFVISSLATAAFAVTALISGFLTISTASLLSVGAFSRPNAVLITYPARNLFRIASHIQVFALSKWLAVTLPVEFYELARGLQWSIPYFNLPWEKEDIPSLMVGSMSPKDRLNRAMEVHDSIIFEDLQPSGSSGSPGKVYGLPLTPMEYTSYFESLTMLPEAEHILDPQSSHGWRDFSRSMFWLAVIAGSLVLFHALLLAVLKLKNKSKEKQSYGALIFPRFEILLLLLSLPCLCEASASVIQGTTSGLIVGVLIVSLVAFMVLCLLSFLSYGITLGKLLQYKEVHRMGEEFYWYDELIRVTLGPGKRGQWTWKSDQRSIYLTALGPLFEDLRGPPKYMVSQISGGSASKPRDRIIASDDETEDAEAPCIQKLFGILRIYYTLIEWIKRIALGIVAGAYSKTWSLKTPTLVLLVISLFQLFFMLLKKPFIKKKVQFVELLSVSSELAIFAFCYVLLEREFEPKDERKLGITMLSIFILAFVVQIVNEWYALYRYIKQLDPAANSLMRGLEIASIGFALLVCPRCMAEKFENRYPINNTGETDTTSAIRSSGSRSSGDKPWLKQIREMARSSFSRDGRGSAQSDASTNRLRWSEFWRGKRSGSSSSAATSSTAAAAKPRGLYKELEDIFASK